MKSLIILFFVLMSGQVNASYLSDYSKAYHGRYCNPVRMGCIAGKHAREKKESNINKETYIEKEAAIVDLTDKSHFDKYGGIYLIAGILGLMIILPGLCEED